MKIQTIQQLKYVGNKKPIVFQQKEPNILERLKIKREKDIRKLNIYLNALCCPSFLNLNDLLLTGIYKP